MKYRFLFVAAFSVLTFSCSINEMVDPEEGIESPLADEVFYATIDDQPFDVETKVYVDGLSVLWNADDRITVFNKKTGGVEYRFNGEEGSNSGVFKKVLFDAQPSGNDLDLIYAVYPHQEGTVIGDGGSISYTLPDVQTYRPNSFGQGANVMVSRTEDRQLTFKNAGGFLSFRLSGADISVSSVILEGRNGEKLAGDCTISVSSDGIPSIAMASSNVSEQVRLHCEDVIVLSSAEYTEFWFALPPVTFRDGLTLRVTTPNGKVYTKSTSKTIKVERCTVTRMAEVNLSSFSPSTTNISVTKISSNAGGYGESVRKLKSSTTNIYTNTSDPVYNNEVTPDSNNTFTITLPTVTDFSELYLNFYGLNDGDKLLVDGKEVAWSFVNSVAKAGPIDASGPSNDKYKPASRPVTLTVCRGYAEKRYTLDASNTGLPVVRIKTEGFTQQDVDSDTKEGTTDNRKWRPESAGQTAKITIEYPDGTVDCDNLDFEIKGRGNATWKYNKRPYALRFPKDKDKVKVLGMKKHRRWILLANWKDRTLLRNDVSFWLSKQTGLPYTVSGEYVELVFNGVHRGNYYLCEQIKIDKNRVNIDDWDPDEDKDKPVTGGFLMEVDNNYDEQNRFLSGFYGKTSDDEFEPYGLKFMFKDPDEDISSEAFSYMKNYITEMEALIKKIPEQNYGYRDYLDINSAIWFMFVNELTGNGDFFNTDDTMTTEYYGPHSTYFYKDKDVVDEEGNIIERKKMFMGPVWDFDYLTFVPSRTKRVNGQWINEDRLHMWLGLDNPDYYYYYMCQDPEFIRMMSSLWDSYYQKVDTEFDQYVTKMVTKISKSESFNSTMWGNKNTNQHQNQNGDNELGFQAAVNRMKETFSSRLEWMNNNLSNLNQ